MMKRLVDPRIWILCICIPFLLGFAPHDQKDSPKSIANSAPPGIGGNGPWDSLNMDLMSRLPLDQVGGGQGNVIGSDCWGWTDPQDGTEYALVGLTNATSFVDISDPFNPIYLGKLPTQTGNATWRDMKVYNNHCFIVADGNGAHGMQVFDLTQLRTADRNNPTNFTNTAWYSGITNCHNIVINEDTGYAYCVGSNRASGGLHVVDISNPTNPVQAGNFSGDGYTHDAQVVTYTGPDPDYAGSEIAFCCNEDTVTIVNVTNKGAMSQISRNGYAQDQYTHQGWLSEDQRYFYMGDELDESNYGGPTRTHVFDCLDLDNVNYLGYHSGSVDTIDHNLYIKDDLIYQANYSSGLRVLEIGSGPMDLTEIAYFDTYNTDNGVSFNGAWSCYPYFDSGAILVNDRQNGMFLVRLSPLSFSLSPDPLPEFISSQGGVVGTLDVQAVFGTPSQGTGTLHVMRGQGIETFPMNESDPNSYEIDIPPTECGTQFSYYFSVETTTGETVYYPSNAPMSSFTAISADTVTTNFADDFESNQGWSVSGNANDGQWERGVPVGGGTRGDPPTDGDGSGQCYLTDNESGNSDIDGGSTILTSPIFDATGSNAVKSVARYQTWFSNNGGGNPNEDTMVVEISNNGGSSWTVLEVIGPQDEQSGGGWFTKSFFIDDFITPTSQMRLRFTASDLNGGSVVEAGVDGVEILVLGCEDGEIITVDAVNAILGTVDSGQVSDLDDSDDAHLKFLSGNAITPFSPSIILEIEGVLPSDEPNSLSVLLEGNTNAPSIVQEIQMYNFVSGQYEVVDSRTASWNSDSVAQVDLQGDISRFVEAGTGAVKTKVTYTQQGAGIFLSWKACLDQFVWLYNQ